MPSSTDATTDDATTSLTPNASENKGDVSAIPVASREQHAKPIEDKDRGEVIFHFGPNNTYFLGCRSYWWYRGPMFKKLEELNISEPYVVALDSTGGIFTTYESRDHLPKLWYSLPLKDKNCIQSWEMADKQWKLKSLSRHSYQTLMDWISIHFSNVSIEQLRRSTVVFGPGKTYFARSAKGCLWNNLPADLETRIIADMGEAGRGPPQHLTLGNEGTWVAFWNDGSFSWNLKSSYPRLHDHMEYNDPEEKGICSVFISPYGNFWVVHYRSGLLVWSVPMKGKSLEGFEQTCDRYMQERAAENDTTFQLERTGISNPKSNVGVIISPTLKPVVQQSSLKDYVTNPRFLVTQIWKRTPFQQWQEEQPALAGAVTAVILYTAIARIPTLFRAYRSFRRQLSSRKGSG
ncbi:hypothetical protein MMC27_007197 [Xylographa pallens]|nr:hypothetical protein [Xylographa pallens]